ncbi:MAG: hypothetical protein ABSG17_25175 [Spirochaetia bacterium]|jgi:hypothetical protein
MRTRLLLVGAAVLFLALVLFGGLAVVRTLKSRDPFYGTFTNEQMSPQKWVTFPGGFKSYVVLSDKLPADAGTERIVARWMDRDGNLWYRTQGTLGNSRFLALHKIDRTGTLMKFTANEVADFNSTNFPKTFPLAGSYTWYRATK